MSKRKKSYNQKKKSKSRKYPYKMIFVSFDDPKVQKELDKIAYREYLKSQNGDSDE